MQVTSMGQTSVKEISPPDLVDGPGPLLQRCDFTSMFAGLFTYKLPRAAVAVVTKSAERALMLVVIVTTVLASGSAELRAGPLTQETAQDAQARQETPADLQQLVAPIALYPDELIAQILAAATYPTEIVQADRWFQQHSNLQGEQLVLLYSFLDYVLTVISRPCYKKRSLL